MKKIVFSIFYVFVLLTSPAQVQLLHSFNQYSNGGNPSCINFETVFESVDCYVVATMQGADNSQFQINIYDANFSLLKTINLVLSDFTWGTDFHPSLFSSVNVSVVGRHLINTDNKIEMIVDASGYEIVSDEYGEYERSVVSNTIIINEDGELVHDFGFFVSFLTDDGSRGVVHRVGNQLRLGLFISSPTAYDEYGNPLYYWNIYSLGGNYNPSTMVTYTQSGISPNPYPNPSRNTISLPYMLQPGETSQLRVFNMNGQLLETFNIGSDFDKILLDVSNYPKGTYIYKYNGVSKKFVVQ